MEVLCNIRDCGYNTGGMCFHEEYLTIKNGSCGWLYNNPGYRNRPQKSSFVQDADTIDVTSDPEKEE